MYGRAIRFAIINRNVQPSRVYVYPSFFLSTQPSYKKRNLVDDIRESALGLPPTPSSDRVNVKRNLVDDIRESASGLPPTPSSDRVNVVRTSTTTSPSSTSTSNQRENKNEGSDTGSFVADSVKQGVVKAVETGLDIGEMAKNTLDNMWDVTKDTTHKVKEAVAGDDKKYDVPASDHFVDDLRKHADGYDQRRKSGI